MSRKKITTEEFIGKLKEKYGDLYSYEKTIYVNYRTKITITDKNGKDIFIFPQQLLRGFKNANQKCTKDIFIERAKKIYGEKYTYDKVRCTKWTDKVIVTCPIHGEFEKVAYAFLAGQGCKLCGNKYYNTNKFVDKAKQIHNDKYDYSKVEYKDSNTKVCIICPEHGEFWQTPISHLRGSACPKCANEKNKISLENFLCRANNVHGVKYDYSKVEYLNSSTKVCIICPEHGEFWQTPIKHINGQGCPICARSKISEKLKDNKEDFIEKAKEIHGDKYDYSKVEYSHSNKKVCIICLEHGEFWQTPHSHLSGQGCPFCKESKGERRIKQYLENNNIEYEQQKMFSWLKYEKPMKLDFYLPKYNVGIEFQGEQHFCNKKWWNSTDEGKINEYFNKTIERDIEKHRLCNNNGIELFYITDHNFKEKYDGIYDVYHTSKSIKKVINRIKNGE